jgi:glycosyltransferase involved in cell wall biosynthesis
MAIFKAILRLSHPRASGLVAVSRGAAVDLARLIGIPDASISVIYNPVVTSDIQPRLPADQAERRDLWQGSFSNFIISIGTLKKQKNHLLLLDAFADLAVELDAGLVILGEGPMRPRLERRICELSLQDRVRLPGFDPKPELWLRVADLFVLSSDYEGFANVIPESLACGLPVVSTACPYGPDEILVHGKHGILVSVGNKESLVNGIREGLSRQWNVTELQRRALDFSTSKQSDSYLRMFGL